MLLPCHVRVFEYIYTRYLAECQGTPCWKQAWSLSDNNGIQSSAKWLSVHIQTKWLWVRIPLLSHIKYEKIFRSTARFILLVHWTFFSVFSQNMCCCHEQKKIILLKHLVGLAFFVFRKYYFVNFVQEVWRVLRCNSVLKGHIHKELFDSNCLPERHFMFFVAFFMNS